MQNSSDHQDWTPVIISGKKSSNAKKYTIEERRSDEEKARLAKSYVIENETVNFQKAQIPLSLSQEIIKARIANNLTQKELAQKLNIQHSIITSYENGKAIPDNQMLQKIAKALNTKFVSKIIKPKKNYEEE